MLTWFIFSKGFLSGFLLHWHNLEMLDFPWVKLIEKNIILQSFYIYEYNQLCMIII